MGYETKEFSETVLESHQRFIDVQLLLAGEERINYWSVNDLICQTPYNAEKDVMFFEKPDTPATGSVILHPGNFAILYPEDAHMPQLKSGEVSINVRKVVVKVDVELV